METVRFIAYDTTCSVGIDAAKNAPAILAEAREAALGVQAALSMFDPKSELSRMCAGYTPGEPWPVSGMLYTFLELNLQLAAATDGAFDPTVAPLVKLWDFTARQPAAPEPDALAAALARVGYQHITLDAANRTVVFDCPGVGFDPGASGKGFALGLAVDVLRAHGVETAVLDFGNNLFVLGQKQTADGPRPWKVAIRDPDDYQGVIGAVPLADMGVSTSSWYEHCFWQEGKVYHHILNARTGMPQELLLKSVSILSSAGLYTDLLSTAFFLLGEEKGAALVERYRAQSGERIEYVAVRRDGTVAASAGAGFIPGG